MSRTRAAELFGAGLRLHQAGRLAEAETLYRQALAFDPRHADSLHCLGALNHQMGRGDAAVALYRQAIALNPRAASYHSNLGLTLEAQGKLDEAAASYRRALSIRPGDPEANFNLGNALVGLGRSTEAEASYRKAVALRPNYPEAHNNLGAALQNQSRFDEAVASFRRALELRPDYPEACNNLGSALIDQGKLNEAGPPLTRALALNPNYPQAHYNLGLLLHELGRREEAEASYRRSIALRPNHADTYSNLAAMLVEQGQLSEARTAVEQALALKPNDPRANNNLATILLEEGLIAEAEAAFERVLALKPDHAAAADNLLLTRHYRDARSPQAVAAEHRFWGDRRQAKTASHPNTRAPERRLRVGYVSPDFRSHSVAYFLEPLLAGHDRGQVEVFAYAQVAKGDAMTERLRSLSDHWRSTVGVTDEALAAMIRADGIDILVDLAGHTAGNRLLTFAKKPAPVQVTWLGYPDTTGLEAMDYRLVDAITDPPGEADGLASEKLVRLEDGFLCYSAPADAPDVVPPPSPVSGVVTFGSFNNPAKLSDEAVATWAALLARLPTSRLMLKGKPFADAGARARLEARFAAHGIAADRLSLRAVIPETSHHLGAYGLVDIGLDPFPYNGATTTCEALWMGVPVVTLVGDRHAARVGASLLTHVGLEELIASDAAEYVEIAAALAQDPARLAALRQSLRPRLQASPLTDAPAFTRKVQAAFRTMWRTWCEEER